VGPLSLLDFLISSLQFGQEAAQEVVDQITSEFLERGGGTVTFNADYSYLMSRSQLERNNHIFIPIAIQWFFDFE